MHMNVVNGGPCALSVNLSSLQTGHKSDHVTIPRRNSLDGTNKCTLDYSMDLGIRDSAVSSLDEGIVGSIMGSPSMMTILSSPVLQRLGNSEYDSRLGRSSLFENKRCIPFDYQGSPSRLIFSPSKKPGMERLDFENKGFKCDSAQQSPMSVSSGHPLPPDPSTLSSPSQVESQGMLHCTWDGGIPHFSFSLDDQRDIYVANARKVEGNNNKAVDYVYSFHLKPSGQRLFVSDHQTDLIGKMKVSTSFSLSSDNLRIMETEFVMVGASENLVRDVHTFSRNTRKSRKLSRVMEVFKTGHSLKQRTPSAFDGRSEIPEDFSADKDVDMCIHSDQHTHPDHSESNFLPSLEMAAIVVKDHLHEDVHQKKTLGGWGLKFLKKAGIKQKKSPLDASASSECSQGNVSDCFGVDIILPAGPHGGPSIGNGGPSSLIERCRSGGQCDCGGWDVGCPLKVLKARPRREEGQPSSEARGDCKSFDVYREGSQQEAPILKMVNIHDNLNFISFQTSSLSPLQCLSIAVAIIHSQSPILRPKHVHD